MTILSGVTIGRGAVIGAGALVSGNVEPYSITAGNPARHIKYRFDEPTRRKLPELAWWDWDEEKVLEAVPYPLNDDIAVFLDKYRPPEDVEEEEKEKEPGK